jgi:hypothetical protein
MQDLSIAASKPTLGPSQPSIQGVRGDLSPGGGGNKAIGGEANHLPLSSVETKKGGAISPLLSMFSWHNA